jgi:hypothetical protein
VLYRSIGENLHYSIDCLVVPLQTGIPDAQGSNLGRITDNQRYDFCLEYTK